MPFRNCYKIVPVKQVPYEIHWNESIANAFFWLMKLYFEEKKPIIAGELRRRYGLAEWQVRPISHLQHFGLAKWEGEAWVPTPLAFQFYHGRAYIVTPSAAWRNEACGSTVDHDDPAWEKYFGRRKRIMGTEHVPEAPLLTRKHFQQEKAFATGQTSLFDL